MYERNNFGPIRKRLRELRARSSCSRRQVAALAMDLKVGRVVAEGWNMERDGLCKKDCPRAKSGAVPGKSRYDKGPTACIAIHAEDMVVRSLRALAIRPKEIIVYVSEEPCYMCKALLEKCRLDWQVVPLP